MGVEGTRVILVEDEALLLIEMQDLLEDLGCIVVGTAARLREATALASSADFDVAILDMNIQGQRIDPVALIVKNRRLPVIFVTGYGARTLPPGIAAPVIDKPCSSEELRPLLAALKEQRHG